MEGCRQRRSGTDARSGSGRQADFVLCGMPGGNHTSMDAGETARIYESADVDREGVFSAPLVDGRGCERELFANADLCRRGGGKDHGGWRPLGATRADDALSCVAFGD